MFHLRPFLAGIVGGGLLAAVAFWSLGPSAPDPAPGPVSQTQRHEDVAKLKRQNARLRGELAEARRRDERSLASTGGEAASGEDVVPEPVRLPGELVHLDYLLAEYEAALRGGALRAWLQESGVEGIGMLAQIWMSIGQPERALQLLRNVDLQGQATDLANWIGSALLEKGDTASATAAFLMALRESPQDWESVMALLQYAPEVALRERAALEAVHGQDPSFRAQTAMLLIATGEKEKGLAAIDALLAEGGLPDVAWDLLVQQDPGAAETRLRDAMDAESIDLDAARVRIVEALRNQGRPDDALREVQKILEHDPDNAWGIETLGALHTSRALSWLENRLASASSGPVYGAYAEQLLRAGRTEEGIGALMRAWELEPDGGYGLRLLELIPDRVAPRLVQEAARTGNDELFGDIADGLWRIGRRQEAESHWRRALQIDPTDSEWIEKLRAVAQGRDPMTY